VAPRLNQKGAAMTDFIIRANIANYEKLLAMETDGPKIAMLRKLLAEEEAKLAAWHAHYPKSKAE
jgi:hypothetical protein